MRIPTAVLTSAVMALAPIAGVAGAGSASADATVAAQPVEQDFSYTGAAQTFTVPDGVTRVYLWASGGAGGDGAANTLCAYGVGGAGGVVSGALAVQPGEQLSIFVGGGGHLSGAGGLSGPDGSRAGGSGGADGDVGSGNGGGGGGATTISRGDVALVVAGGGGGGGGRGISALQCGGDGGAAGAPAQAGFNGTESTPGAYGMGGTPGSTLDQAGGGHGYGWSGAGGGGGGGDGVLPGQGGGADQSGVAAGGGGGGAGGGSTADASVSDPQYSSTGQHGASGSVAVVWGHVTTTSVPPATARGGSLPLHAIVSDTDGGGSVDFTFPTSTGPAAVPGCTGIALIPVGDGVDFEATCNAATQLVESDTVTATYSGDYAYGPSAGSNTYSVTQLPSSTSASVASTTITPYDAAVLAVTVSGTDGYGTVQIADNGTPLPGLCRPLQLDGLTATTQCSEQIVTGQHSLTVSYSGDRGYLASSAPAVTVTAAAPLAVSTSTLPGGEVHMPYSAALSATGGLGALTWMVTSGGLPAGLTLQPTGVIVGTPTKTGSSMVTVQVTDSSTGQTAATALSITVTTAARTPELAVALQSVGAFVTAHRGTYSVSITNRGTAHTTGATTLHLSLPTGLTAVGGRGLGWHCVAAGSSLSCTRAKAIAAHATTAVTVKVQVIAKAGVVLSTTATVTPTDTVPADNSATEQVSVGP